MFRSDMGIFAGKDWPILKATTREGKIAELQSIPPFDDIDYWCRQHDICYADRGFGDTKCDDMLLTGVNTLRFGLDQDDCRAVVYHVAAFANSNPLSTDPARRIAAAIIAVPAAAVEIFGFGLVQSAECDPPIFVGTI